ncbi:MAG: nucleoside hydrolase [Bryobacteraceae bacterium]
MIHRLLMCFLAFAMPATVAATPVRLIFDTDIGNDIDDALALALIHSLQTRGEATLLAVTVSKDNPWAAPYVDILNTFYGRPKIPIGAVRDGKTREDGNYVRKICSTGVYPHELVSGRDAPEAILLLRRILAAEEDGAVVVVQTGFSTNLARLLKSPFDSVSPLSGVELVRRKVRFISMMGGNFSTGAGGEYNIVTDLEAERALLSDCPVPVVVSGYEIGKRILYPARSIETDFTYVAHHPVAEAYRLYDRMPYDRPTWDLTSVLYAVRPEKSFDTSQPGRISVTAKGQTVFTPEAKGLDRYLLATQRQCDRALAAMLELVPMRPRAAERR